MSGLEGLQQALNKAAEQAAESGQGEAQEVSAGDADKMKSLLSDIDKGLQQAEQANQTQAHQEVKGTQEAEVADNGPKSLGDKILDKLENQQAKMDEVRSEMAEIADKVASGDTVDPGTLFSLQMKVFEVQHMTETASKAGGQISEDMKKLQSGQ